jgi:hypothetical protein
MFGGRITHQSKKQSSVARVAMAREENLRDPLHDLHCCYVCPLPYITENGKQA